MKTPLLPLIFAATLLAGSLQAQDTTPPVLDIQHTWIEKVGTVIHFKMLLDPRDETGLPGFPATAIQFRSKLNSTAALPANTAWNDYPWVRGQPFSIGFNCTSVVFEIRAKDAAGNFSPLQRRTFKSPFPFSPAPNLEPKFGGIIPFAGAGIDCQGLFADRFDDQGYGDDIMQIDRTTGTVSVRRQGGGGSFVINSFALTPGSINDSAVADFNGDGRPDLAVVVDSALKVFMNDGVVAGNLQFTEFIPPNYAAAGISNVLHCAVGDLTGEGKPEIVISGTGDDGMGGTVTKVSWFLNNGQFQLDANNTITPSATTVAGLLGVGDATGDGWADVIMADPDNTELILFQNTGIGSLASDGDATEALRPQRITTGFALGGLPVESMVVGDVTGDGRADAVVTMHFFGTTGATPNDDRDHQIWQLFEGRGAAPLFAFTPQRIGRAPSGTPHAAFKSDVILQDLNGDRFPEVVLTSQFPDVETSMPAGIRAIRLNTPLNSQNFLTGLDFTQVGYATNGTNPHRLTSGRFSGNSKRDILVANGGDPQLQWVFNNYTQLSKPLDGAVGVTTDSDPSGTADSFGTRSYYEYLDGSASFSLTFVNNSATDITGAFADCTFPANFSLNTDVTDVGWFFATVSGAKNIRWPVDIPAGTAVVRTFRARIISGKAKDTIKLTANLRKGTVAKGLITVAAPFVQISGPNLTVVPNSAGQPWSFTYRPSYVPGNGLATIHTSPDGSDWTYLNTGLGVMAQMTDPKPGSVPYFTFSSTVPAGTRYIRAMLYSFNEGYKYSSVFNNFLPPTEGFKVSTKSPPKSGQTWTFSATQTTTAANASVRFQSTLTPGDEGSWTDLPAAAATVRKTNTWTFITNNVPPGSRSFRAISAAPGWVDSISQSIGPVPVTDSPLLLGEFSKFHADFVGPPVKNGDQATFIAVIPSVSGIRVRFQSKLASESDLYWTDLPDGAAAQAGTTWTLKTKYMPVGDRNFRAIASAPGYYDKTSIVRSWVVDPPLPQYPTIFGPPSSVNGPVLKAGQNNQFKVFALDGNGVQRVYLESLVGSKFTRVGGPDMAAPAPGNFNYTTNLVFSGTGTYTLRAAVVDSYNPAQTLYSSEISVLVGLGNGTTTPTIGNITWVRTQATAKARGAIKISAPVGDDKQVYRVFLHRTTAEGAYISTVGEMVRAGNTNPATFSFTHSNLTDSTYAYRIVAHDFDGNETISNTVPPIAITTPAPEPGPIHLDIAASSRFGPPTMPASSGNYKYMPVQSSGTISFTYSGLPAGGAQFYAYRAYDEKDSPTFWNTDFYFWTGSTTKTSGEFKNIKAPFWTNDKTHPKEGEGTYRIVACVGGKELPHGSGVRDFVIGHAWNHPHSFSKLDWGLYWFKSTTNGLRCRNNQNDEYFDRSKPTVIYVHGWQADEVNSRRRESWDRQDPYKDSNYFNMCKIWRDRGYNVGMFNWNQFGNSGGPNGLLFSQANIYYIATEDGLPAGHSMIYAVSPKMGETKRLYDEDGSDSPIIGKTVCDLFTDEMRRCMAGYTTSSSKEFRLLGHSLGTQVVGRSAELLRQYPGWGVPLPTRICLMEIAQIPGFGNPIDVPLTQRQFLENLVGAGVALECYQSTDLQSILGINLAFVGPVHDMAAYARYRPDYILPVMIPQTHNDIVRWYMESRDWIFNAYTYWAPFAPRDHVGKALSAATSTDDVWDLMGGPYWFEQSEGKNSGYIKDDVFERKTR